MYHTNTLRFINSNLTSVQIVVQHASSELMYESGYPVDWNDNPSATKMQTEVLTEKNESTNSKINGKER